MKLQKVQSLQTEKERKGNESIGKLGQLEGDSWELANIVSSLLDGKVKKEEILSESPHASPQASPNPNNTTTGNNNAIAMHGSNSRMMNNTVAKTILRKQLVKHHLN